jgi:hypothetical protein
MIFCITLGGINFTGILPIIAACKGVINSSIRISACVRANSSSRITFVFSPSLNPNSNFIAISWNVAWVLSAKFLVVADKLTVAWWLNLLLPQVA